MKKDVARIGGIALVAGVVLVAAAIVYQRGEKAEQSARVAEQAAKQPKADGPPFIRPHSHIQGPADAKVTVVEFLDPECESCRGMYPLVKHLLAQVQGKVRLVIRYMPFHPNSMVAISALECAAAQGRYWELLESLFANQPQWGSHHAPKPELIPDYAHQLGLDMAAFHKMFNSAAHRTLAEIDRADGEKLGVKGTPTFFVNGRQLEQLGYETLKAMIDEALAN
jgi:protein-disulfide isomerase